MSQGWWRWRVAAVLLCALAEPREAETQTVRLYEDGDGRNHLLDVLIGKPPGAQRVAAFLDAWSGVFSLPCAGCEHCGDHEGAFDFSRSGAAAWVACEDGGQACDACAHGRCSYARLGRPSGRGSVSGSWFRDLVALGGARPLPARLVCSKGATGSSSPLGGLARGSFGIAPAASGAPGILGELFGARGVDASRFALCLAERGGLLTVGGHDSSLHVSSLTWIDMNATSRYRVFPLQIRVEGSRRPVAGQFGKATIDTARRHTHLPEGPYRLLREAIRSFCQEGSAHCGGAQRFNNTCWTLPGLDVLSQFPVLHMRFLGGRMLWRPHSYLSRESGEGLVWCYGFESSGPSQETVLGASWMLHRDVVFDLPGRRLGLAEARCPGFTKRGPSQELAPASAEGLSFGWLARAPSPPRPWLASALLAALILLGLWSVARNLSAASARAERLSEAAAARRRRSPKSPCGRGPGEAGSGPAPVVLGRPEGGAGGVPVNVWLRSGAQGRSSDATPGSPETGSSPDEDPGLEEGRRLL